MITIWLHIEGKGNNWSQTNKKTNFFKMRIADFRKFLRESANPFINLCSKFDNSNKLQQKCDYVFRFHCRYSKSW